MFPRWTHIHSVNYTAHSLLWDGYELLFLTCITMYIQLYLFHQVQPSHTLYNRFIFKDAHHDQLQPQDKYAKICLLFSSSVQEVSLPYIHKLCPFQNTVLLSLAGSPSLLAQWPASCLPGSPDHGLQRFFPQLEMDWITEACNCRLCLKYWIIQPDTIGCWMRKCYVLFVFSLLITIRHAVLSRTNSVGIVLPQCLWM